MSKGIAIGTVFYPNCIPYLGDYAFKLRNQTFQKFTLIAFNDGIQNLEKLLFEHGIESVRVVEVDGSIAHIRNQMMHYFSNEFYNTVIFLDADDYPSYNHVEDATNKLDSYPLVFSDLSLIDIAGNMVVENYWSDRIENGQSFTRADISTYNFLGLGNCAIRTEILNKFSFWKDIMIPDWFIFYNLIDNYRAIFSHDSCIYYRQHEFNLSGFRDVDSRKLENIFKSKLNHYDMLIKSGFNEVQKHRKETAKKHELLSNYKYLEKSLKRINTEKYPLFWWEETELV